MISNKKVRRIVHKLEAAALIPALIYAFYACKPQKPEEKQEIDDKKGTVMYRTDKVEESSTEYTQGEFDISYNYQNPSLYRYFYENFNRSCKDIFASSHIENEYYLPDNAVILEAIYKTKAGKDLSVLAKFSNVDPQIYKGLISGEFHDYYLGRLTEGKREILVVGSKQNVQTTNNGGTKNVAGVFGTNFDNTLKCFVFDEKGNCAEYDFGPAHDDKINAYQNPADEMEKFLITPKKPLGIKTETWVRFLRKVNYNNGDYKFTSMDDDNVVYPSYEK